MRRRAIWRERPDALARCTCQAALPLGLELEQLRGGHVSALGRLPERLLEVLDPLLLLDLGNACLRQVCVELVHPLVHLACCPAREPARSRTFCSSASDDSSFSRSNELCWLKKFCASLSCCIRA